MSIDILGGDETTGDDAVSRVSFHHVNINAGNESVLLRFEYDARDEAACILIDAGEHIDLNAYLEASDRLAAVCLTHAHADHYQSLDRVLRDDVPLYTSPTTADMLETVLTSAEDSGFVSDPDRILTATTPVDGWTEVAPGVRIHPVPAGHTPGAVGYVVRFSDGTASHDMLFTGDFTLDAAGGFPGFDPAVTPDVEALFLTVATADDSRGQLTDGLGKAVERAHAGGQVLVTAGGLQGVRLATLLATVSAELDLDIPVRVVGQAAKLYDDLGYDLAGVELVPEFARPEECLDRGVVTVAGPDIPTEGSSGRLYEAIQHDPNACLVQFVSSGKTPVSGGGACAAFDYHGAMHPTKEALDDVVAAIDPVEVVTVHEHGGAGKKYNDDWNPCIWSSTNDERLDLYEDGRWLTPWWMDSTYARVPEQQRDFGSVLGDQLGDFPLVSLDRSEAVDLAEEGVDLERIRDQLRQDVQTDRPTTQQTTPMADSPNSDDESNRSEATLYPTVNAQVDATGSLSEDSLVPDNMFSKRMWGSMAGDATATDDRTSAPTTEDTESVSATTDTATAEAERTKTEPVADTAADTPATSTDDEPESSAETDDGVESEPTADVEDAETPTGEPQTHMSEVSASEQPTEQAEESASDVETASDAAVDAAAVDVAVDPLLLALVERQAETSVGAFVADALQSYLEALLRHGEPPEGTAGGLDLEVVVGDHLGGALTSAVDDEGYESVSAAVRTALAGLLGEDTTSTVAVLKREFNTGLIDAAVDNDDYGFETRRDFVDAAVLWALDGQ